MSRISKITANFCIEKIYNVLTNDGPHVNGVDVGIHDISVMLLTMIESYDDDFGRIPTEPQCILLLKALEWMDEMNKENCPSEEYYAFLNEILLESDIVTLCEISKGANMRNNKPILVTALSLIADMLNGLTKDEMFIVLGIDSIHTEEQIAKRHEEYELDEDELVEDPADKNEFKKEGSADTGFEEGNWTE